MKTMTTLLLLAALSLLTACPRHMMLRPPMVAPMAVVIPAGHVHSHSCGHHYHGGRWYYTEGHVHGHGCGHYYDDSHGWIYRDEVVVVERGHSCHDHCGHYYRRGSYYYSRGHVHGHGCGHVYRRGLWVIVD